MKEEQLLKNYLEDGKLSEEEKKDIYKLFGYENSDIFWQDVAKNKGDVKYLIKNYDLNKIPASLIENEIVKVYQDPDIGTQLLAMVDNNSTIDFLDDGSGDDICERIRKNCILSVGGEALAMHMGCAALDLSVVAGLICHGGVILYQKTANNNCNLEAERCRSKNQ